MKKIVIGKGITNVGFYSFIGFKELKTVVLPDSITRIESFAFGGDEKLASINIPDSVEYIGDAAFIKTASLKTFTFPSKLRSIERDVFDQSGLESVVIPENVSKIGDAAFYLCKNLKEITILNPDCNIFDNSWTIASHWEDIMDETSLRFGGVISGYDHSTAQAYAKKYGYSFESLGEAPTPDVLLGDSNFDGKIDSSDATFCLVEYAKLATGDTSSITYAERYAANVNKDSAVDSKDASAILSYYSYTATGGKESLEDFLFPKTEK